MRESSQDSRTDSRASTPFIHLERSAGFRWHRAESSAGGALHAKGAIHTQDGRFFAGQALADYLAVCTRDGTLEQAIADANGVFALIATGDFGLLAAVDPVRSIPLFFALEGERLLLADDADVLRGRLDCAEVDDASLQEFVLCGYAVGSHTLIRQIKEIRAGEWLLWQEGALTTYRYYRHLHGDYLHASSAAKHATLVTLSRAIAERLIESAAGRPLIVPLSGGYDSRYIACMLHEAGFTDVLCYTYGRPDSKEVVVSRAVAQTLGYPWHYVEYTDLLLIDTVRSDPEWQRYCAFCHNRSALPHVQEYVALRELHAAGSLPHDGIVVPGFCGDLLGGSYIPVEVKTGNGGALLRQGIVDYICDRHMANRLFFGEMPTADSRRRIQEDIASYNAPVNDLESFVSLNEAWFTSHKVAKFVVNSLRVYEFFGHEWRMPLWDRELLEFWYRIPLEERIHKQLYDGFLFAHYFEPRGVGQRKEGSNRLLKLHHLMTSLGIPEAAALSILKQAKKLYQRRQPAVPHFNAFDALERFYLAEMPELAGRSLPLANINGIYARWFALRHYGYQDGLRPVE